MYGSIEFGGTKIRCAKIDDMGNLLDEIWIKTDMPEENMDQIKKFFAGEKLRAMGVGAFGPIDVNKNSKTYGMIQNTPKEKWAHYDLYGNLKKSVDTKIEIVTDVGLSAIGEYEKGAGKDCDSILYLTIGTGIGGAYIQNGKLLNGLSHPEMGHIEMIKDERDRGECICSYHKNCFEGLASGPSLMARLGKEAKEVDISDESFDIVAGYIGQALITYSLVLRPEIIILGGGLMNKEGFIEMVREKFDRIKGTYLDFPDSDKYIVTPGLGNDSALVGGYYLGKKIEKEYN